MGPPCAGDVAVVNERKPTFGELRQCVKLSVSSRKYKAILLKAIDVAEASVEWSRDSLECDRCGYGLSGGNTWDEHAPHCVVGKLDKLVAS